ncbi:TatD family hydrolase [Candidatus Woesearchaeota archaeon]|nr:TatD family hydrolase [Candidatus Woesearchaeota archaeon]
MDQNKLIDLHAHLDHPAFKDDQDEVIARAKEAGVSIILISGVNPKSNRAVLDLCSKYPDILKASLGIYPIDALQREIETGEYPLKSEPFDIDEEIAFIEKQRKHIHAVGECGLDYHWIKDKKEAQKKLFAKIIALCERIDKPLIVHSRKAEDDCIAMLKSSKLRKVNFHCFTGNKKLVKQIAEQGWYFSVPANIVRSQQFQELVKEVPLSHLFCETDSPYLSPFKEKRNEPAFIMEGYKKIAELKRMELAEVAHNIYMNWQRVFT